MDKSDNGISLREFVQLQASLEMLQRELTNLRSAIEKLTVNLVTEQAMLAKRVDKLESDMRLVRYVSSVIGGILVALAIAWAKSLLGV